MAELQSASLVHHDVLNLLLAPLICLTILTAYYNQSTQPLCLTELPKIKKIIIKNGETGLTVTAPTEIAEMLHIPQRMKCRSNESKLSYDNADFNPERCRQYWCVDYFCSILEQVLKCNN